MYFSLLTAETRDAAVAGDRTDTHWKESLPKSLNIECVVWFAV